MTKLGGFSPICLFLLLSCGWSATVIAQENGQAGDEKEKGPKVRFLCVSAFSPDDEIIVASKNEEGEWLEHGKVELRSSFITSWVNAVPGKIYLTRREGEGLVSVGAFKMQKSVKHSIAVLMTDTKKNIYRVNMIDPNKLGFRKGMSLVRNYSRLPALVVLGEKRTEVMPGKEATVKAVANEKGMYRMLVGYQDDEKKLIPCFDRYIQENPDAREFLLLFPDSTTGLKVFSLSEFGPFE